jgi:hypothetical protein
MMFATPLSRSTPNASSKGRCTGITFVDSTPLAVCHPKRIACHQVFDGYATRGQCSMGWYFGFKLHLMVNDQGEILGVPGGPR